ncbi:SusC/RagA family TonB-linked outer membrane protein [Pedobacter sp. KBW06]|uniref:SusC/RagA family TonB-linked outer membrane protein n=1 Tax=Pedobacter sp. KBW06 TaxID=2153359 RepID=UPI000F5A53B9|nr:SusC/RagA family TonB-linked outer membrane protein [Pedobacter sp. KBW06]RQO74464.1 SusC/RagA family TonB-linked outer membrane protein [Pedobacter sp. KBW06]
MNFKPDSGHGGNRQVRHKFLLIMKMIIFLLTTAIMQVSAGSFAQKITLDKSKAPLGQIINEITVQSGYDFLYNAKLLELTSPVTIRVKDASLEEVLAICFKNQPLTYKVEDNAVWLKKKENSFLGGILKQLKLIGIRGRVVDSEGKALSGASVIDMAGKKGISTDENGQFYLADVEEEAFLTFSYIGYITRTLKARANMGDIVLQVANSKLDAVQVVGYGTTTRRFSVGATATVTADEIQKQPVNNVLLTLQGRVPGLVVTPNSGAPGASVRVQIRGQNTLQNNLNGLAPFDQPLFIIDGVPFAPQNGRINLLNTFGSREPGAKTSTLSESDGFSAFSSINPANIESITILKDADATSIYGSQGSNGVILITTKKGKAGKTDLGVHIERGVNFVARPLEMLNTDQYLELRREAIRNDQVPNDWITPMMFPDLTLFDQGKYTNWYKQFYNRTSNNTVANASLSGGTQSTNFRINGGYSKADYNFPGDFADELFSFHSSVQHNALGDRLNIEFGTDYSYEKNNTSGSPNVSQAFTLAPNVPDLLDSQGNLVWKYGDTWLSAFQQYAYLKQASRLQNYNLNSHLRLGYNIVKGLKFSTNLGYSRVGVNQDSSIPLGSLTPEFAGQSSAAFVKSVFETLNVEPQIDYQYHTGKGRFTALLGGTYKKTINNSSALLGYDYATDALLGSINGARTTSASDEASQYKYVALFGRLGYIYKERYIINLTGRRDGSSNFGPNRQFGNFGSVGLGWIFSEEGNFKKALPFVSYAKLSGNYGTSGSDGVAPYQFQSFWSPVNSVNPFQGTRPFVPGNLYNPEYSWALKRTLNLGLDIGIAGDLLLFNLAWYSSRSNNQLSNYILPAQTGFSSVLRNFDAEVENTGLEFSLNSTNVKSKNFSWTTNFNISFNRNKLLAFPGLENSPYAYVYTLGKSVNTVKGFNYKGVNPTTGLFEFHKPNGELTSTPNDELSEKGGDIVPLADLQPKFIGGLGNTFTYKNLSLTTFFQFAKQTSLNYKYSLYNPSRALPGGMINLPTAALAHWQKDGDIADLQRVSTGFDFQPMLAAQAFSQSSGVYSDASYIRLKTVSLEYRLPERIFTKAGMTNLRVFVNAQNLLTITGYKVGDPEKAGNLYSFPLQRTVTGGLSFNF